MNSIMSKVTMRAYVLLWCQWGGFHPNSLKLIPTQMPEDNGHISLHLIILRQYSVWIFQLAAILAVCLVRQNSTARWHGPRTFSWQIVKVVPSDFQYFLLFFVSFSRFYTCRCLIKYFFFTSIKLHICLPYILRFILEKALEFSGTVCQC